MSETAQRSEDIRQRYTQLLDNLFSAAFSASPFDALCTILRVGGMADANWDPFEESRIAFDDFNWMMGKAISERDEHCARRIGLLMYCQAIEMTAPHEILANLLRCIKNEHYIVSPFLGLGRAKKNKPFSWVPPSAKVKFQKIKELATQVGQPALADAIDRFFDERIRNAFSHSDYILTTHYFRYTEGGLAQQIDLQTLNQRISECFGFYGAFLWLHRTWLHSLSRAKKFHKWPQYEVLELLPSEEEGLYGFNVHFSNGSKATYSRRKSGTEAINLFLEKDGGINFMVGNLDDLQPIWKVNGQVVEEWEKLENDT